MANTAISHIGEQIQASGGSEHLEPVLGDGAAKAGMLCGILNTGKAIAIDANSATAGLHFAGIMDRHYSVALDTAITDALLNNLMVPKSGRLYRVFIEDFGAVGLKGSPLTFATTTAGSLMVVATVTGKLESGASNIVAYIEKDVANGDTVALIRWA